MNTLPEPLNPPDTDVDPAPAPWIVSGLTDEGIVTWSVYWPGPTTIVPVGIASDTAREIVLHGLAWLQKPESVPPPLTHSIGAADAAAGAAATPRLAIDSTIKTRRTSGRLFIPRFTPYFASRRAAPRGFYD